MTGYQERAIEALKNKFLGFYGHPENKEFKEIRIKEFESGEVYVLLEVGYIGDEGTMKEVICRNTLSVIVGKQGGFFNYSDSASHYKKRYNSVVDVICKAQWK